MQQVLPQVSQLNILSVIHLRPNYLLPELVKAVPHSLIGERPMDERGHDCKSLLDFIV
jgi:hypothetical protein